MVNQTILDYLKNYSKDYSLEDLENKILSGGYSKEEFDEAVDFLNLKKTEREIIPDDYNEEIPARKTGFLIGMGKFTGILLILLMGSLLVLAFFSNSIRNIIYNNPNLVDLNVSSGKSIFLGALGMLGVLFLFFNLGFVKIGKMINSKLIRFSSWIIVIIFSLILVLTVSWAFGILELNGVSGASENFGDLYDSTGASYITFFEVYGGMITLIGLIFLLASALFFIGLIVCIDDLKFGLITGILGVIEVLGLIIFIIVLILFPEVKYNLFFSGNYGIKFFIIPACFYAIELLLVFFETRILFSAKNINAMD